MTESQANILDKAKLGELQAS